MKRRMIKMIKKLLILSICLISACAFAQSDAYDAMKKFLKSKKLEVGFNPETKRIVAIGMSEFPCTDMKDSIFTRQRMLYMKIAVLNAKADIIKNISSNVSAQEEYKSAYKSDSKLGDLSKDSFKSQISCLAAMPLKGIITLNHAESYDAAKKQYQIAVAVVWSAKSEAFALGTRQAPKRPNKKPGTVQEWLRLHKKAYGSRTFIDKDGKVWFLGIAQYPLDRGRSIAKSFASLEAQAIVNYSLYSDIASQEKAAQLMKNSDNFKGKSESRIIETLAKNISQSVKNAKSKAVMLSMQEVTPGVSGIKHLAVAYGYAPEITELKKVAKKMPAGSKSATKDDGFVISFGTGMDKGSATRDALIEAIKMVNGAAMQANAQMQQKFASAQAKLDGKSKSASVNVEKLQKNVKEQTNGFVDSYSVITFTKLSANKWEVKLRVKIYKPGDEQANVVVTPTGCEEESEVYKVGRDKRMSAVDIAAKIQTRLESSLSGTNKFGVIDRANLLRILREQSLNEKMVKAGLANPRQMAKIGNMLSADYLVLSKLLKCNYSNKAEFDPRSGRVKKNTKFDLKIEIKVVSAVNGDVVLTEKANAKLSKKEIKKATDDENDLLDVAITKAIKQFVEKFTKMKGKIRKAKSKRASAGRAPATLTMQPTPVANISSAITLPETAKPAPKPRQIASTKAKSKAVPEKSKPINEPVDNQVQKIASSRGLKTFSYKVEKFVINTDAIFGKK